MSESQNIVNSSLKAASLNMMTQVIFRLVTFFMNAFVLRYISRDVLGLIYVRLNLLDDTIIFLRTEGFRLAGLGHKLREGNLEEDCELVNLMWLTVLSPLYGVEFTHGVNMEFLSPLSSSRVGDSVPLCCGGGRDRGDADARGAAHGGGAGHDVREDEASLVVDKMENIKGIK